MESRTIKSTKPFPKYLDFLANIAELYLESGQTTIIDAYRLYVTRLTNIIHKSELYIYSIVITKYLLHHDIIEQSDIIKQAIWDLIVESISKDQQLYDWFLSKIESIKSIYFRTHTYDAFCDAMQTLREESERDLPEADRRWEVASKSDWYVYGSNILNIVHAPIQHYTINKHKPVANNSHKKPLVKVYANGTCVAYLRKYGRGKTNATRLFDKPVIKCIDCINNIRTLIKITNYKYIVAHDTYMITSIDYEIKTDHGGVYVGEYTVNIEYPL